MLDRILHFIGQYRPMLFFGLPGTLSVLAGLGWGLWVVDVFQRRHMVLLGSAVVSVTLCIGGAMALFTGVVLRTVRDLRDWLQAQRGIARGQWASNQIPGFIDQERYLVFFGAPGVLLLTTGLGWGLWVVDVFRTRYGVPVGSAIISASLCIAGAIALATCFILHSLRVLLLDLQKSPAGKWQ